MTAEPPTPIDEATLAALLGVTTRTIRNLVSDGTITRLSNRPVRYDPAAVIPAYCEHLRNRVAHGKATKAEVAAEHQAERTRLAREQADKLALANAVARRDLIPAGEVEREWSAILREVRAAILAVPTRVEGELPHLTRADVLTVDRAVRDALNAAAGASDA